MLNIWSTAKTRFCDGQSRREFLKIGSLGLAGLSLADLLCLQAQGAAAERSKAVIFVYLFGGPSHIDTYDLKPDAPVEYRGEFKPIQTKVPGFDICELMPLQAKIADKLALIRNMKFNPNFHEPAELLAGYRLPAEGRQAIRPDFGSVVSRLRGTELRELPAYIALDEMMAGKRGNGPGYLGIAHKAFFPGSKLEGLELARGVTLERLGQRKALLDAFDRVRQEMDQRQIAGMDAFTAQAMAMISSPKARDALDVSLEPESVRARYGDGDATRLLQARRLIEAGVPVVTLTFGGHVSDCTFAKDNWDTHQQNFACLRAKLPRLDRALYALVTDLHERGMDQDVLVVVGGEMGRTPRVGQSTGNGADASGRDHWPQAGFTLMAGGGLQMGQVIGKTTPRAERPAGIPYTPQNLLATIYRVLGIDPDSALPDHTGRPIHLLDDSKPVRELV